MRTEKEICDNIRDIDELLYKHRTHRDMHTGKYVWTWNSVIIPVSIFTTLAALAMLIAVGEEIFTAIYITVELKIYFIAFIVCTIISLLGIKAERDDKMTDKFYVELLSDCYKELEEIYKKNKI